MKYKELDKMVEQELFEALDNFEEIHDRDIQEMALIAAKKIDLMDFKASPRWTLRFKKRHRIRGLKFIRLRTRKTRAEKLQLEEEIKKFQSGLAPVLQAIGPANVDIYAPFTYMHILEVFNMDQMGINLEMTGSRALGQIGTRRFEVTVQRVNATTHSLTVQPLISAAGNLMSPMLVVFQEVKEPKKFQEELSEFINLIC